MRIKEYPNSNTVLHSLNHNFCSADIDECLTNTDQCEQGCTNTDGTYVCNCSSGYELLPDGYKCAGWLCCLYCVRYLANSFECT